MRHLLSIVLIAILGAAALFATMLMISRDKDGSSPEKGRSGSVTPTSSLGQSPQAALERLQADPYLGKVAIAVAKGDIEEFLILIDWKKMSCTPSGARGNTELCVEGAFPEAPIEMVNVGDTVDFWITAETLRPYLEQVMAPGRLSLRYQGTSKQADARTYLGFEGDPAGFNFPPVGSGDARLTGVFVIANTEVTRPIERLSLLIDSYGAADAGLDSSRIDEQTIVTLVQE